MEEAARCVEESVNNVYQNPTGSSLCFHEWTPELQRVQNDLLKVPQFYGGICIRLITFTEGGE